MEQQDDDDGFALSARRANYAMLFRGGLLNKTVLFVRHQARTILRKIVR